MADKITIGADLDTTDVTKKLSELQNKLKNMRNAPTGLSDSPRDMQMKQAFQRSENMYREKLQKQYESQDKIIGELLKKEKELSKQLDQKIKDQKKLNELQQEYLQTTNQIQQTYQSQNTISKTICPPGTKYDPATRQCVYDDSGDDGGGGGPGGPGGGKIAGLSRLIGAAGSIAAVAKATSDMADFLNRRRDTYSAERSASLAESMYEPSRQAIKGQSFDNLLFAEERNRAFQKSMDMGEGQMGINRGKAVGAGLAGTAGIGLGLLGLLASPFTGGASLALTGTALMAGGAYGLTANKGMGYEAMFGDIGEVDKMTGQQMMEYYKGQFEKEKAQDMTKTMLKEFLSENRGELIKGIRGSGMSEQEYMKRYVQGYGMAGAEDFVFNQRNAMTQQILQAGGGSQTAYGQNMVTALQAQRSLGLTNAGQTMGRLSNYLNAEESEEAFVKILGKGVSIGLDKSQFREEQKDYFNQVTAIAQNVGAGEQLISSIMTAAIGREEDINRKNVEFAANAVQDVMGDLSKQGGRIGAQKYRNLNKNKMLEGLSKEDRFFLGQMNAADLEAGNPELEMYWRKSGAKDKGISIEEFAKSIRGDFSKAITSGFGDMTKRYEEIAGVLKEGIDPETGKELTKEQRSDLEVERTRLYSFMADKEGTYKARRARQRGLSGFERQMGSGEDFVSRVKEYDQLKSAEMLLNPEARNRLSELEGTTAAFKGRPEGLLERMQAGVGQMQQQELRAKTAEGKDINAVMSDFAKNLDDALKMEVEQRQVLKGFQKALEDGATEVVKAIIQKVTGSAAGLKNVKGLQNTSQQRASVGAGRGVGGPR